jgi:hypothetical protein
MEISDLRRTFYFDTRIHPEVRRFINLDLRMLTSTFRYDTENRLNPFNFLYSTALYTTALKYCKSDRIKATMVKRTRQNRVCVPKRPDWPAYLYTASALTYRITFHITSKAE